MIVSRILSSDRSHRAVISLILLTRNVPPKRDATNTRNVSRLREAAEAGQHSCSVLHRTGFIMPLRLLSGRWALTPPFQPYPPQAEGGIFSATLSVTTNLRSLSPCLRTACYLEVSGLSST